MGIVSGKHFEIAGLLSPRIIRTEERTAFRGYLE